MDITQKYRPRLFKDVHQPHVTRLLQAQLKTGEFTTAYLFSGPSGVGKTTVGRILASAILDDARKSGADEPDITSETVQRVANQSHPDLYEINCSNHNGVDDVREMIIGRARLQPKESEYKIFLLDECHRLTPQAMDALLKILEEPPQHVIFILCSTDPMKLLDTIRSRCHWHTLRRVPEDTVVEKLKAICDEEKWSYDLDGLQLIARHTQGGVRDALKLLDRVHSIGITDASVRETLGKGPRGIAKGLLLALMRGDRKSVLLAIDSTLSSGYSLEALLEDTARLACEVMESFALDHTPDGDVAEIKACVSPRMTIMAMDGCLKAYGLLRQNLPRELVVKAELMNLIPQIGAAKAAVSPK